MSVESFVENTPLSESMPVKAMAATLDAGIAALGEWLDGLTAKIKESGKTEGVDIKGLVTGGVGGLSDPSTSPTPAVPRSKQTEIEPPAQGLVLEQSVAMKAEALGAGIKANFPRDAEQGVAVDPKSIEQVAGISSAMVGRSAQVMQEQAQMLG